MWKSEKMSYYSQEKSNFFMDQFGIYIFYMDLMVENYLKQ